MKQIVLLLNVYFNAINFIQMKRPYLTVLSILIFACSGTELKAQVSSVAYNTFRLERNRKIQSSYSLNDTVINRIGITAWDARVVSEAPDKFGSNIARYALARLLGSSTGPLKDVVFEMTGKILTNDTTLDWRTDLFCQGTQQKVSQKEKEYGITTVSTSTEQNLLWGNGLFGYVIEKGDTIGRYKVLIDPRKDTLIDEWTKAVYKGTTKQKHHAFKSLSEYALYGEFTGKKYAILYNSDEEKIYIFEDSNLYGIYTYDRLSHIAKKRRLKQPSPSLLVNETLTEDERVDIIRLAMVGQWLKKTIDFPFSVSKFNK